MRFTLFRAATVLRRISHFKLSRRSDDAFVSRLFGFRSAYCYVLRLAHRFLRFANILKCTFSRCFVSFSRSYAWLYFSLEQTFFFRVNREKSRETAVRLGGVVRITALWQ